MLDIDTRIRNWRHTLLLALGGSQEIADELESHLRDDLDARLKRGEKPDQAWLAALAKLGAPSSLAAEYAHLAAPVWWWPIPAVWSGTALVLCWFAWIICLRWMAAPETQPLLALHVMAILIGYLLAFSAGTIGLLHVVWSAFCPLKLGQRKLLVRTMTCTNCAIAFFIGLGIILGGIWARQHLGGFWTNDPREIATSFFLLWSIALALAWRWKPMWQHAWLLLAVAGNIVACVCWFGAYLVAAEQLHSYGDPNIVGVLVCVGILHAAFIALGMLQPGWARRLLTRAHVSSQ